MVHTANILAGKDFDLDEASKLLKEYASGYFVDKFVEFQNEYDLFLLWCLDNNAERSSVEWDTIKSEEFKKRGLHNFFL